MLENRSLPNLTKGLQGTIPNLNLNIGDGKPIQSPTYNIRNVNSISIMRYAEILLNYAEAKTELGTLTNEDGKNDVVFYKIKPATQLPGVTYINVAETVNGVPNPQRLKNDTSGELTWLTNIPRNWNEKYYLYPIPENDRLLNPKLCQNPGW
ncbi:RagB/SusD family nutrient uptake outer membrane protein [Spirosoma taeanense]|uniref:RagB/SusD family nutrient uptake outer membrane protein n=1 Tax=Spirosoma taeanense TaxID=2735870 RepID=UPI00293BA6CA|nr:RagB/SusD family nutrient uptake outer membrane protein [Spirosoma taeanense]